MDLLSSKRALALMLMDAGWDVSGYEKNCDLYDTLCQYLGKPPTNVRLGKRSAGYRIIEFVNNLPTGTYESLAKSKRKLARPKREKKKGFLGNDSFFGSDAWKKLRYKILLKYDRACMCCGCKGSPENPLQVDHVLPRSKYPKFALDEDNLQVLCRDCNSGKSNIDDTDFRADVVTASHDSVMVYDSRGSLIEKRPLKGNFLIKKKK